MKNEYDFYRKNNEKNILENKNHIKNTDELNKDL